jgi:hypothetical protein
MDMCVQSRSWRKSVDKIRNRSSESAEKEVDQHTSDYHTLCDNIAWPGILEQAEGAWVLAWTFLLSLPDSSDRPLDDCSRTESNHREHGQWKKTILPTLLWSYC